MRPLSFPLPISYDFIGENIAQRAELSSNWNLPKDLLCSNEFKCITPSDDEEQILNASSLLFTETQSTSELWSVNVWLSLLFLMLQIKYPYGIIT